MHIHLDALGGISGNMFIGALLDLWPEHAAALPAQLELAGFANLVDITSASHNDGVFTGTLATMDERVPAALARGSAPAHAHRRWQDISRMLQDSKLAEPVKTHALGIFTCLAEAEAKVHGMPVAAVEFHEVGAWDSIADIVCAAWLIERSGARTWSVSTLPLGKGRVTSAHGQLPVPAPAVALLLQGYAFADDGREGERVTPTGAAILKYLRASQASPARAMVLQASGVGFGTRAFPGISNVLRALVFSEPQHAVAPAEDSISILSFEVDDQSPEDLAVALDQLRRHPGVLDVLQYSVHGKKQRSASSVRVLARTEAAAEVQHLCFVQTTTLGIRLEQARRSVLQRWEESVELEGRNYRVKLARRPDGQLTAKAELDDLAIANLKQAERQLVREVVEVIAIERNLDREDAAVTNPAPSDQAS